MAKEKWDIAKQVEREHACLKRDMGVIDDEIMREVSAEEFGDWRLEFMWRLRDFRNHLCKHFDLEEEGGFMADIINEAPEAMKQVEHLEMEHTQIMSELDNILTALKSMERKKVTELQAVQGLVQALILKIRAHENAENQLIQRVYNREYGYPGAG